MFDHDHAELEYMKANSQRPSKRLSYEEYVCLLRSVGGMAVILDRTPEAQCPENHTG